MGGVDRNEEAKQQAMRQEMRQDIRQGVRQQDPNSSSSGCGFDEEQENFN